MEHLLVEQGIFWGSFLVFPWILLLWFLWRQKKKWSFLLLFLSILTLFFLWARFVEPQIIRVQETHIPAGFSQKILLLADTHIGVYKSPAFLERVVQKINEQKADMVLIAGDFVNHSSDLRSDFAPLARINKPVYAIFGNHDAGKAGGNIPDVRTELGGILTEYGVTVLQNEIVSFSNFTLVGIGSNWAKNDQIEILKNISAKNTIVLTHNPDTTLQYTEDMRSDFTLVGHTHCGQVRIPWLYKFVIPTKGDFDKGLTSEEFTKLFITCGLGEVGIPLRLFNPPTLDLLVFSPEEK